MSWRKRQRWNHKMQDVALDSVYPAIWPDYDVIPLDQMYGSGIQAFERLARKLDVGGIDKVLVHKSNGSIIVLADRFRTHKTWAKQYRDFTIRESEWCRHIDALKNGGMIPKRYVYAYANKSDTDFGKLFVVRYHKWLRDITNGLTSKPYYKDMRGKQESFYYWPWSRFPSAYLFAKYEGPFNGSYQLELPNPNQEHPSVGDQAL